MYTPLRERRYTTGGKLNRTFKFSACKVTHININTTYTPLTFNNFYSSFHVFRQCPRILGHGWAQPHFLGLGREQLHERLALVVHAVGEHRIR